MPERTFHNVPRMAEYSYYFSYRLQVRTLAIFFILFTLQMSMNSMNISRHFSHLEIVIVAAIAILLCIARLLVCGQDAGVSFFNKLFNPVYNSYVCDADNQTVPEAEFPMHFLEMPRTRTLTLTPTPRGYSRPHHQNMLTGSKVHNGWCRHRKAALGLKPLLNKCKDNCMLL